MKIVTGYRGTPHISANDQQAFNQGVIGGGNYVLDVGNHFEASLENVNTVQIRDGNGVMQGVHFRIEPGDFEELNIENGTTGFSRIDLIVARYSKDSTTGIESVDLVVIKGEDAASNPVEPAYNTGSILDGDSPVDFPLYQVTVNELTPSLLQLFNVQLNMQNITQDIDVSAYVTLNAAWSSASKSFKKRGNRVFFNINGYTTSYIAKNSYNIATIRDPIKPKTPFVFPGITTDVNYVPVGTVAVRANVTDGAITVIPNTSTGGYWFLHGWYEV